MVRRRLVMGGGVGFCLFSTSIDCLFSCRFFLSHHPPPHGGGGDCPVRKENRESCNKQQKKKSPPYLLASSSCTSLSSSRKVFSIIIYITLALLIGVYLYTNQKVDK